jgi:hypothetical protein
MDICRTMILRILVLKEYTTWITVFSPVEYLKYICMYIHSKREQERYIALVRSDRGSSSISLLYYYVVVMHYNSPLCYPILFSVSRFQLPIKTRAHHMCPN